MMRVVSLAPSNTEILFELGIIPVGVTAYCDYPADARNIPKIGSWMKGNVEKIEALNPDVLLASMFLPEEIKEWAEKKGVRVVTVNPQTLEGIYESFEIIGKEVGREQEAKELVAQVKEKIEEHRGEETKRRIYTEEFGQPPTVAANWVPELVRIAGGIPMAKPGILSYEVKEKNVAEFDPDLIILHWCGHGTSTKPSVIEERWPALRAVKNKQVHVIHDSLLNRPGPRIWQGIVELRRHMPKLF